ncbi:MAG: oxidoreductase [Candidatus Eremiobacteraeota bacterium]|nr:oxidoreductase [Candidatus Eremiobacteraeota bacterium]
MSANTEVVVIGAGYAGILAARLLSAQRGIHVTIVNPRTSFVERIRLHQVAASTGAAEHSLEDAFDPEHATAIMGTAREIDAARALVHVQSVEGEQRVPYDYLVYAPGSATVMDAVPGAREHAFGLLGPDDALRASAALEAAVRRGGDVTISGGGLTAIETAAEIAERYPALRVSLLSASALGGPLSPEAVEYVRGALLRLGVQVREHVRVAQFAEDTIRLDDGAVAPSDASLFFGGFAGPELARASGLETNSKNQLIVDATLRSARYPNILGAGDAAVTESVHAADGMGCKYALQSGRYVATAIADAVGGRATPPFECRDTVFCVSLGRRDAVLDLRTADGRPRGTIATGEPAVFGKELVSRFARVTALPDTSAWHGARQLPDQEAV